MFTVREMLSDVATHGWSAETQSCCVTDKVSKQEIYFTYPEIGFRLEMWSSSSSFFQSWSCFIDKSFVKEPKIDYFYSYPFGRSLSVLLSTCYFNVKFDVMKICMITSTHISFWAGLLNTISAHGPEF